MSEKFLTKQAPRTMGLRKVEGGPYHGQEILIGSEHPSTMVFTAKGMTGHYTTNGTNAVVWVPKI